MAGPRMRGAGCEALARMESVAVMGIVEVLARYRELSATRRRLMRDIASRQPHAVVGIDSPDFNLGALEQLRASNALKVQFVSPQVWAWRRGRIPGIARVVDLLLTILPFEPALYAGQPLDTRFVGHPIADELAPATDRLALRRKLGLSEPQAPLLAVLPGSRRQEIRQLAAPFFAAAARTAGRQTALNVVCPYADRAHRSLLENARARAAPALEVLFREQAGREALAAADCALVASGTATLEGLLTGTPLVVAYRVPWLNYAIMRPMLSVPYVALPNLLAGEALVPEFLQMAARPAALSDAVSAWLEDPARRRAYAARAAEIGADLRRDASRSAAAAILDRCPSV